MIILHFLDWLDLIYQKKLSDKKYLHKIADFFKNISSKISKNSSENDLPEDFVKKLKI